jgi:4'-phosphopantetheinyl transferase
VTQIYIAGIRDFISLNGIDLVTSARRKRINKFLQVEDKARCLLAGLLMRKLCGIIDESQLIYGENGKPYLKDGNKYFNISHSGNYVILALSEKEVGIDIEKIDTHPDKVAVRCFTTEECEWMRQEESDEAFYKLWTAKESVMKATGLGFSLSPGSFCVLPIDSSEHRIIDKSWFLDWAVYDGYVICCAVEGQAGGIEIITVNPLDLLEPKIRS